MDGQLMDRHPILGDAVQRAGAMLNKHNVPERGMFVDAVLNIFLAVVFGMAIEILAAGNLGYILAHVFALSGFFLLRRDRPNWPGPIKLSRIWLPIAGLLALANLAFVVLGGLVFANKYWYGLSKTWIGVGVLCISVLLYIYRRRVQDGLPLHFRESTPTVPSRLPVSPLVRSAPSKQPARRDARTAGAGASPQRCPVYAGALD